MKAKTVGLVNKENSKSKRTDDERIAVRDLVEQLSEYDIVSFDIFDTLILRPFNNPSDLFRILSIKYNMVNFYSIRINAEKLAREKKNKKYGHKEITLQEIYQEINIMTGIDIKQGVENEFNTELEFCYANPYMKEVFDELIKKNKKVIIVSDMYIPHDMMEKLLEKCGYSNYDKLFVSCDYNFTKRKGELFQFINEEYVGEHSIIHVGDNTVSDISSAKKNNWDTYYYKRNGAIKEKITDADMSPTIGSLYKGIVCNYLNNGANGEKLSNVYYKYGFIYSGILILGYVNWIHQYAKKNKLDKLLFLSRDGYILKRVYDSLYKDIPSEYTLWSRHATLKTSPQKDIDRYIWQFVTRIVNENEQVKLKDFLEHMNLQFLKKEFSIRNINLNSFIDKKIADILKILIKENIELITENNKEYNEAAKQYYKEKIGNSKSIGIVDLGWRGSGAIALKDLFENDWNFKCDIKALLCFGLSRKKTFDDTFILNDTTASYTFSDYLNCDLSGKFQEHYILNMSLIEILVSSAPQPSFLYFYFDELGKVQYKFDREETENYEIINDIYRGIYDFIKEYITRTNNDEMLLNIQGRDACTPLFILLEKENYEEFINDFYNFSYTYLIGGVHNEVTKLGNIYYERLKKEEKKIVAKKRENKLSKKINKIKLVKKLKKINKILKSTCRRLANIFKNSYLRSRYYYSKCYEKMKIDESKMIFQSYAGDNFSGNPYYILKMLKNDKEYCEYKMYVAVKKENVKKTRKFLNEKGLKSVKIVDIHSKKYCELLCQCKYLINNVAFPTYFIKKTGQIYVNTWHGTPLKGLGKQIKDAPHESGNYQRNFLMSDYMILPNEFTYKHMRQDYMIENLYKGQYIVSGYPRNSIFYDRYNRQNIIKKMNLENKKVIVYMPTWRRKIKGQEDYQIEKTQELLEALDNTLPDNYIVYIKLHNLVKDDIDVQSLEKIKMFPEKYETYEFLSIADCLITDYSSVLFDYANTCKKIILYAYDEEEYMNGRSMYMNISDLPFHISREKEDVIDEVRRIDDYNNYEEFKKEFCAQDSLELCQNICNYIFHHNGKDKLIIRKEEHIEEENVLVYGGNLKDDYKRENLQKILKNVDKKNIMLNFYMKRVSKNKLEINKFSDEVNYIMMQGERDLLISEGIAYVLYYKFKIRSKFLEEIINNIYIREIKRLFPTIRFTKVVDLIGDSIEIMNIYKNIDCNEKIIIINSNNIFNLNKRKNYKKQLENNIQHYNNVYVLKKIESNEDGETTIELVKQFEGNLFQIKENIVKLTPNDLLNNTQKIKMSV